MHVKYACIICRAEFHQMIIVIITVSFFIKAHNRFVFSPIHLMNIISVLMEKQTNLRCHYQSILECIVPPL